MSDTRIECDTMGEMEVPSEALYGASTQRAVLNFPISGEPVNSGVVHAYGLIKWAAARINGELGHVDKDLTAQIETAAEEVYQEWTKGVPRYDLRRTVMNAVSAHPPSTTGKRSLKIYGVTQDQIDRIFANIEDQAMIIKAVFDEKIVRLKKGDELPPGVFKTGMSTGPRGAGKG